MTILFVLMPSLLIAWLVYVIALTQGQLRINFTSIFKVFTKLPESRNRAYHIKGKIIEAMFTIFLPHLSKELGERFVKLWYFVAFKLLIFSPRLCPSLEIVSPVVRTSFCVFVLTCVS